jgi:hypothetical protein
MARLLLLPSGRGDEGGEELHVVFVFLVCLPGQVCVVEGFLPRLALVAIEDTSEAGSRLPAAAGSPWSSFRSIIGGLVPIIVPDSTAIRLPLRRCLFRVLGAKFLGLVVFLFTLWTFL